MVAALFPRLYGACVLRALLSCNGAHWRHSSAAALTERRGVLPWSPFDDGGGDDDDDHYITNHNNLDALDVKHDTWLVP